MKNNKTLWIAGAVVVLLAIVAIVATSGGDDAEDVSTAGSGSASATQPVTPTGEPLVPYEKSASDPAVGVVAPALVGASFDGSPLAIEPTDGTAKLVLFVAHWCPHCQREVPFLVDHLADSPLPDDVELVTVSTAVDEKAPNYPPQTWLEDEGWTFPVLADSAEGAAADAYGLTAFPYFVALHEDGTVAARASGELSADELEALVAAAQGG